MRIRVTSVDYRKGVANTYSYVDTIRTSPQQFVSGSVKGTQESLVTLHLGKYGLLYRITYSIAED